MSMQLYLIRHAESENNARPEHLRQSDPPISATGRLQASRLAEWASTLKIDILITSPFLRTLQTTRMITDAGSQHVHVWHDVCLNRGDVIKAMVPPRGRAPLVWADRRLPARPVQTRSIARSTIQSTNRAGGQEERVNRTKKPGNEQRVSPSDW